MRNTDLERVILTNLDDPGPYHVYADWLQSHGDVRGEVIVAADRDRAALIEQHAAHLLGPFAERKPRKLQLTWRHGFIRTAEIGWRSFGEDSEQCEADFDAFLALASCCFLESLSLGPVPGKDQMHLDGLASVIEERRPATLRTLDLGDTGDWDLSSTSTAMPRSEAVQGLHTLTLRAGNVTLGAIDLPDLRSFTVESGGLTVTELGEIARANWPNLESLVIWFGDRAYGATGSLDDIRPILDGVGLPKLARLGLMNCEFVDDIARALPDAKILPQLESLDLSMGCLSDAGLAAMLAAQDRFSHLRHLELDDNALTDAHWPAARALAKNVAFGTRHDPARAESRYVSVGE